jgi:large conductance mechanosensitive channel
MLKEFKAFALRGNVLELAVAVILGLAFNAVITSLVNDVIMNFIAAIFGQPDFSGLTLTVGAGVIQYGLFINAVVNFMLIALVLFFIVKAMNRAMGVSEEPPKMAECPFCRTSIPVAATRCPACTSELTPQAA